MNKLTQPKGSVSKETNKESIARIFGIEKSSVGYLSTSVLINPYIVLYDESTETCWYRGTATGTTISWSVSGETLTLVTSIGTFSLTQGLLLSKSVLQSNQIGYGASLIGTSQGVTVEQALQDRVKIADLASSEDGLGSYMVNSKRNPLAAAISTANSVATALSSIKVSVWEFRDLITDKPDAGDPNTWDWSPAFQAAFDAIGPYVTFELGSNTRYSSATLLIPPGYYRISSQVKADFSSFTGSLRRTFTHFIQEPCEHVQLDCHLVLYGEIKKMIMF
ncbi:hypothetical protein DIDNDMLP_00437 [Klebsiella phage KP13-7]|nr:hypothetical protein DIDNDMLP_00437 [Klebsiella phage KP13-7]